MRHVGSEDECGVKRNIDQGRVITLVVDESAQDLLRYSQAMSKESKNPEVRDLKALMNRGPRNRWEGMKLRALKNRYLGVADSALATHQQIPTTPPRVED